MMQTVADSNPGLNWLATGNFCQSAINGYPFESGKDKASKGAERATTLIHMKK